MFLHVGTFSSLGYIIYPLYHTGTLLPRRGKADPASTTACRGLKNKKGDKVSL